MVVILSLCTDGNEALLIWTKVFSSVFCFLITMSYYLELPNAITLFGVTQCNNVIWNYAMQFLLPKVQLFLGYYRT